MEQHPVPQQFASYQFRLVGDMTLKQFFQVAGGALLALLIYATPLPSFFKWPLIGLFVVMGIALAFLPIEERPLEMWLVAFFRSIYNPTLYYWNKPDVPKRYFAEDTTGGPSQTVSQPIPTETKQSFLSKLEQGEKEFLSKIFSRGQILTENLVPETKNASVPTQSEAPQNKTVEIPVNQQIRVEQNQQIAVTQTPTTVNVPLPPASTTPVAQTLSSQKSNSLHKAEFSPDAAPPSPPTQANIVVGQVMDINGKIIDGAILEIRDIQGRPVRALRSNKVGHFMMVIPLENGKYELSIKKTDLSFDSILLEAKGSIIDPIAIRANQTL